MGRQQQQQQHNNNTHSSIALLQQRFKQLERTKEMREQRELLKLFPVSERIVSSMHYKPYFVNPELSLSPPSSHYKKTDYGGVKAPSSIDSWRSNNRMSDTSDNNEVDTSLHL